MGRRRIISRILFSILLIYVAYTTIVNFHWVKIPFSLIILIIGAYVLFDYNATYFPPEPTPKEKQKHYLSKTQSKSSISDAEFRDYIIEYLLGEDWHAVGSMGQTQVNLEALISIIEKYSSKQ